MPEICPKVSRYYAEGGTVPDVGFYCDECGFNDTSSPSKQSNGRERIEKVIRSAPEGKYCWLCDDCAREIGLQW